MGLIRTLLTALAAGVALLAILPILILGLPFWMVSALARPMTRFLRRGEPPALPWADLIEFTPEIGWRNRPGLHAVLRAKRAFQVTMDDEGWRGSRSIEESEVLVVGDSFAFGHGVDDRDFFADRCSRVRVKALGADGYNMVQELLWMERLGERLRGKVVVWFVFYGNDLMDNLRTNFEVYPTPFLRSTPDGVGWEVVTEHVSPARWPFDPNWGYRDKIAEICTPGRHSQRAFSACDHLVEEARRNCEAWGASLAVVGIPDVKMLDARERRRLRSRSSDPKAFDPDLPDRTLAGICREQGVPFVSLSGVLSVDDHLPDDCHWTPTGHGRVARLLDRMAPAWVASVPVSPPAASSTRTHD